MGNERMIRHAGRHIGDLSNIAGTDEFLIKKKWRNDKEKMEIR
jgi:hypothetical protein